MVEVFLCADYSDEDRLLLQEELIVVIMKTLIKQNHLNYYQVRRTTGLRSVRRCAVLFQGYHDICLTFLLVLGGDLCLPLIDTITKSHFKYEIPASARGSYISSSRDFMAPTMEKTRDLLSYLMPLIHSINSECAEYMQR